MKCTCLQHCNAEGFRQQIEAHTPTCSPNNSTVGKLLCWQFRNYLTRCDRAILFLKQKGREQLLHLQVLKPSNLYLSAPPATLGALLPSLRWHDFLEGTSAFHGIQKTSVFFVCLAVALLLCYLDWVNCCVHELKQISFKRLVCHFLCIISNVTEILYLELL